MYKYISKYLWLFRYSVIIIVKTNWMGYKNGFIYMRIFYKPINKKRGRRCLYLYGATSEPKLGGGVEGFQEPQA